MTETYKTIAHKPLKFIRVLGGYYEEDRIYYTTVQRLRHDSEGYSEQFTFRESFTGSFYPFKQHVSNADYYRSFVFVSCLLLLPVSHNPRRHTTSF